MVSEVSLSEHHWRQYFAGAGGDIWAVIDNAIRLAALDFPSELRQKRDAIAERLFAPVTSKCLGLNELSEAEAAKRQGQGSGSFPVVDAEQIQDRKFLEYSNNLTGTQVEDTIGKLESSSNGAGSQKDSYEEAEELADAMEAKDKKVKELRIFKRRLSNIHLNEKQLLRILEELEHFEVTFQDLTATDIAKELVHLRKTSKSPNVRASAKNLIRLWKETAKEWEQSVKELTSKGTDTEQNPNEGDDDEESGLPSPPMDEGALLAVQSADHVDASSLLDFFNSDISDGLHECEIPDTPSAEDMAAAVPSTSQRVVREYSEGCKYRELAGPGGAAGIHSDRGVPSSTAGEKQKQGRESSSKSKDQLPGRLKEEKQPAEREGPSLKQESHGGHRGSPEPAARKGGSRQVTPEPRQTTPELRQRQGEHLRNSRPVNKTSIAQQPKVEDYRSPEQKLAEATKRLRENYQEIQAAKKSRTIQVMEPENLPPPGSKSRGVHGTRRSNPLR